MKNYNLSNKIYDTSNTTTTGQGNVGLIAACLHFSKQGYSVFTPLTENAPFDLVVYDEQKEILKVEVKSTRCRNKSNTGWLVQVKQTRSNKVKNTIKNFDNTNVDILCVYIVPLDKLVVFNAKDVKPKTVMLVSDSFLNNCEL